MILPKITIEKQLLAEKQSRIIVGIDEVGRGPLAGPVVAAACWVRPEALETDFEHRNLIRDSKLLSAKQRETVFAYISQSTDFVVGIGEISEKIIDKVNILGATFLAMRFAIDELLDNLVESIKAQKGENKNDDEPFFQVGNLDDNFCLLLDGNKKIPKISYEQHVFAGGDRNIFSIAAASICAKVYRDRLMEQYHEKYPEYGFLKHKGYGTREHMAAIKKHGPCQIHRRSFAPVREQVS